MPTTLPPRIRPGVTGALPAPTPAAPVTAAAETDRFAAPAGARSRDVAPQPGGHPRAHAVHLDRRDEVRDSGFGIDAVLRFDPDEGRFGSRPSPRCGAAVRTALEQRIRRGG